MAVEKLLVANRGEIAIRVCRAAVELGIETVAVYAEDDARAPHVARADCAVSLSGSGAGAYLDGYQLISVAREAGCDALHPGYGFLAESAAFAAACREAGVEFVGPSTRNIELLGNKLRARALAAEVGVPVVAGSEDEVSEDSLRRFLAELGPGGAAVLKAVAGGGGRGMWVVRNEGEVGEAFARCRSEAEAAFGNGALYVEQFLSDVRHIEVQVIGDRSATVVQVGERECSVQRRHQKLVEIAPSPALAPETRTALCEAALEMARRASFESLGTFEFLVERSPGRSFAFIEANPRLQVEHTVTEEVTGIDLVKAQLRIAGGETLADLDLEQASIPSPSGFAIEARVNGELLGADGSVRPALGEISRFSPPAGPGIRVDSWGAVGYSPNPAFDPLLAKVIAHSATGGFEATVARLRRALNEFEVAGLPTNLPLLSRLVADADFIAQRVNTGWFDENSARLAVGADGAGDRSGASSLAGAEIDRSDPLASLDYFRSGESRRRGPGLDRRRKQGPPNTEPVPAPLQATVTEVLVSVGDIVGRGQTLVVMSALKMEHPVEAPDGGVVRSLEVSPGDTVLEGSPLVFLEPMAVAEAEPEADSCPDLDYIRPSLRALLDRRAATQDDSRPAGVERRHSRGRRTVRENIEQLIDPGTWLEYGQLTLAGQRARRSLDDLIRKTPADGLVAGIGSVNGDLFDEKRARTMFISYDDTVLAGTQGARGHDKTDRMVELANELSLPVIFHAEGAGGRSGDTEIAPGMHPSVRTFERMAQLSGKVPMIGVTAGWCYAGNASVLGMTDIIIATKDSLIAMGGPSTIEGGGLGVFLPEEVGPASDTVAAGTVDILVSDHDEAITVSKKCLSYFQGSVEQWACDDQRPLREVIPENRHRTFDIRELIAILADRDSVLELRPQFGPGMVTAFVRIEGHPFGLTANNNAHLGGAIDSPGSDKVARFWQLCDAFNIPLISLVDTPGMMVGPDVERSGLVRHCSRLFVTGANLETPRFSVVLRKGYALGSIAVMTGSSRAPVFTVSWPEGEFGGMNLESGVLLGSREALAEIENIEERAAAYQQLVDEAYERAGALHSASVFGIDDVIDPAKTRRWIVEGLKSVPDPEPLRRGRRTFLDTW